MWEQNAHAYMNQPQDYSFPVNPMEGRQQAPPPPHYQHQQHQQQQQQQQHMQQHHSPPPSHQQPMQAPQQHQQMPSPQMLSTLSATQKPRGKMTPYACFVKVIRAEHKKKHPNESIVFSEFSKKCAEKWRQMTDKEKRRFQEMAEKDKERYECEMQHYQPPDGQGKPRPKKRKKPKDPDAPKRALSAFMWFCKDFRHEVKEKNPEMRMGDIAKVLSIRWKDTPDKEKYENRANQDKSRYADAMKIFRATKGVGPHGGKVTNAQARAATSYNAEHGTGQAAVSPGPPMAHAGPQNLHAGMGPMPTPYPDQYAQHNSGAKKARNDSFSSSSSGSSSDGSSSDSEGEQESDQ